MVTRVRGFTLIELLVVLAIIAILITIAVPRYIDHVERARETALKTDLKVMREAIDKFEGDQGRLPRDLQELVFGRYLKEVPIDPITDRRDTWTLVSGAELAALAEEAAIKAGYKRPDPPPPDAQSGDTTPAPPPEGLAEIHSGAKGMAKDGTEFRTW